TNLLITPSATGASGKVYLVLVDFGTKPASIVTSASYSDELVKTPEGWRFKKRATKGDVAPPPATK
ncbi:MAG: nuclear transport factor 2 family protein, partial [Vicinamibacterales bacterium]